MAYLWISEFSETTGDDVEAALKDLRKHNGAPLKGLVLDLAQQSGRRHWGPRSRCRTPS